MGMPTLQLSLPLRDYRIQAMREALPNDIWLTKPGELEAAAAFAGFKPGWLWHQSMYCAIAASRTQFPEFSTSVYVGLKELGCVWGDPADIRVVLEKARLRDLHPIHPLEAFNYLLGLRDRHPERCKGVVVLYTGDTLRDCHGNPFLVTAHYTRQGSWLSPLYTTWPHGATQFGDHWVFATA